MEHGAIVPDVDGRWVPVAGHVRLEPRDGIPALSQAGSGARQRGAGHVEDRHTPQTAIDQAIDETGIPASDIDDSGRGGYAGAIEQAQRGRGLELKPAQVGRLPGRVNTVPMGFCISQRDVPGS